MDELLKNLGKIFGLALLQAHSILAWGFTMLCFYNWFILTTFQNMPTINYIQAIGLWLFSALLKAPSVNMVKEEYLRSKSDMYVASVILPWIVLLVGLIISGIIT